MRDLARRVLRLEDGDGPGGGEPRVITIRGGLPDGPLLHASIGRHHRIRARPDEDEDAFRDRALDLAEVMGEPWVIIGGLPPDDPAQDDFPAAC